MTRMRCFTIGEISRALRVCPETVARMLVQYGIRVIPVGKKQVRVPERELERLFSQVTPFAELKIKVPSVARWRGKRAAFNAVENRWARD